MSNIDSLYTQYQGVTFGGPSTSDSYNTRIQQNYMDLTLLKNNSNLLNQQIYEFYGRFVKDQFGILQQIENLESRVAALTGNTININFYNTTLIDNNTFANTTYAIPPLSQLNVDTQHGLLTLPTIPTASVSKLAFVNNTTNNTIIPSSLATTVNGVAGTADNAQTATIDTTAPEFAMARIIGRIWQRNVVVTNPVNGGAQMELYIQCPTDIYTNANSNNLTIHPFPAFQTDILNVEYTTSTNVTMSDSDGYIPFPTMYTNIAESIGWIPPGTWGNGADSDLDAGFRSYYFDPIPITGLRLTFGQRNYYQELGNYIYSYGASLIDLSYITFLSSGTTYILVTPPNGKTISNITSVQPQIYNIPQAEIPYVFNYLPIYETSYNSGIFTTTPVAFSQRCWIQINLSATTNGGSPSLSGLTIQYE